MSPDDADGGPPGGEVEPTERHITVARTARYVTLGEASAAPREVWFVCHGYGQLAGRFARHFAPIVDGTRLVVAPEGLSRFYLADSPGGHARARVGATWMTREDRLAEIDDYVAYLDALSAHVLDAVNRARVRVCVLGFSQGVATAARWVARGAVRVDHLILWAGTLPPELDLDALRSTLRRARLSVVLGDADELAEPATIADQRERLARHAIAYHSYSFAGGHRLDAALLVRLATEGSGGA